MKYMLLIYNNPSEEPKYGTAEFELIQQLRCVSSPVKSKPWTDLLRKPASTSVDTMWSMCPTWIPH